ncbi:iron transporter [Campylobacter canadensis]|uniref:Iron transporter n=1 Tax=Campylobacter canadensis TaxID=449520 RepID=A0ABS7WTR0_9BACT|nr:iron transporter [Campylobacter canadensis]MBZ7987687.1 iron transporter [Campylobacter canadensis]MBZ7994990.1 iron transporter [Campylobacter canadensis]MBZ7996932.1 iron transporter [Campylobacter canadensis]MBZ7998776.1 iron transporter [Campylobacter canadensis]MBZ8000411.1 iron transporter [Campylobacter canadensis]
MKKTLFSLVAGALLASSAIAGEVEIPTIDGAESYKLHGMEIAAVYLQPIEMEPRGIDLAASLADIHLEADIHALKENPNGFPEGFWMPYLTIGYKLTNTDNGKTKVGKLMPMVADDGPHYGANIKMDTGIGNYELVFVIDNPEKQGFGRHVDKETGVDKWFDTFSVKYKFKYTGTPDK